MSTEIETNLAKLPDMCAAYLYTGEPILARDGGLTDDRLLP